MKTLEHITKLSELVRIAIDDMKKIKADDRYEFDVDEWHRYDKNTGLCSVCVAGSVMAGTMELFPNTTGVPSDFDHRTSDLLDLLDDLRAEITGTISNTLEKLGMDSAAEFIQYGEWYINGMEDGETEAWEKFHDLLIKEGL